MSSVTLGLMVYLGLRFYRTVQAGERGSTPAQTGTSPDDRGYSRLFRLEDGGSLLVRHGGGIEGLELEWRSREGVLKRTDLDHPGEVQRLALFEGRDPQLLAFGTASDGSVLAAYTLADPAQPGERVAPTWTSRPYVEGLLGFQIVPELGRLVLAVEDSDGAGRLLSMALDDLHSPDAEADEPGDVCPVVLVREGVDLPAGSPVDMRIVASAESIELAFPSAPELSMQLASLE